MTSLCKISLRSASCVRRGNGERIGSKELRCFDVERVEKGILKKGCFVRKLTRYKSPNVVQASPLPFSALILNNRSTSIIPSFVSSSFNPPEPVLAPFNLSLHSLGSLFFPLLLLDPPPNSPLTTLLVSFPNLSNAFFNPINTPLTE